MKKKIEKVGSKLRKACGLEKKAKEKEEKVVVVNFDKTKKK